VSSTPAPGPQPEGKPVAARRRRPGLELAAVVAVALAVLAPGIGGYSLVDPWEGHYGEVGRMMRQSHDYVHLKWPGTNADGVANEGFRSKPVLAPWLIAAGLSATGVAADGGYSGEMVAGPATMIALRLPFVLCAVAGLTMLWWMLARLVSRRLAWLALLVVGSSPMFCMIARQAIPDMALTASVMGAISLLILAIEDGDRPCAPLARIAAPRGRRLEIDARHVVLGLAGGFVVVQAAYYAYYFAAGGRLALRVVLPPAIWLPAVMLVLLALLSSRAWRIVQPPLALVVRAVVLPVVAVVDAIATRGRGPGRGGWAATASIAERALAMAPITTMRQVYLLGAYGLLGVSALAKGPPGIAIAGGVGLAHVVLQARWRALAGGGFELKRGVLLLAAVCVPWHVAMLMADGFIFFNQYILFHIVNRAATGVDSSPGTFEMYSAQLGVGLWLWAALLPAAVVGTLLRTRPDSRAERVRFLVAIWAIVSVTLFCVVQTKFHHYILPAVPPLGVLVAFFLDDLVARRDRLHPLLAALGVAIALLICRDLMHEPERWIEMFVYRDDRPWPAGGPWQIDPSDGFLALGALAALGIALAATRWRRAAVAVIGAGGLAICVWALQVYMPIAGKHWGMGDAIRAYYDQRTIYGETLVYFGTGALYDDWHAAGDRRSFETHVPAALQVGQPMTVTIRVHGARDERVREHEVVLVGAVTAVGDHRVELALSAGERARLAPLLAGAANGPRGRPAIRVVDADRLIAWRLYWRGENFWSAEEIWGPLPEMKTTFARSNSTDFLAYLNDATRAPPGRRYFVISDAGYIAAMRAVLPTQRARDSFEIVDTTSNKFSLAAFTL
jgi:4-amino-4-deoxy-L-arabinose transferase-like glycosyltransferase